MRVVFDCRSVFLGMGGIGRYAGALSRELPRVRPEDEFLLLYGARRPEQLGASAPNVKAVVVDAAMIDPVFEQVRLPGLLDEVEADVYHGTCFATPIARGRTRRVATVHDVVFRRRPELVPEGLRSYLDRWTEVSCDLADAVVTVSEFSRREIAALYGRGEDRIDVVPNAVEERFFDARRTAPRERPYVLYVGALEAKKNIAALIASFDALSKRKPNLPHELLLAGSAAPGFDLDAAMRAHPGCAGRVRALGHVPEGDLPSLYAHADLFCYLSEYEGFGLPPLEAMAAGVPTIVADRTSLPEVTSGGAVLVDPADPDAVARAMADVLDDHERQMELSRRGKEVARSRSWRASAERLGQVYAALVGERISYVTHRGPQL